MVTPTGLVLGRTLSTEARVDRSDDGSSSIVPRDLVMHNRSGTSRRSPCLDINLLNVGQEGVVCSHALRGGDWVWLA
jgi:hypothetical protein